MQHFKIFIELTRINKPVGFMLLFWPCSWGLAYAQNVNPNTNSFFYYLLLFFLGSVLMRSAGCIFNDVVDKDFDKRVKRTKKRLIASGKISVTQSLTYVLILSALAFFILVQFNILTILLGMGSMLLAFSYPFMKRITYWPQLFLGVTFNWGLIMGWSSISNNIRIEPIILYCAAIFWTLGYDTIYGLQDIQDDEIIGIKSTSIKFKNNVKIFVGICYTFFTLLFLTVFYMLETNNYFLLLSIPFILSLIYQVKSFNIKKPKTCLDAFKNNNLTGLLIFIFIFSFNIL